jgi:hypothetical protein
MANTTAEFEALLMTGKTELAATGTANTSSVTAVLAARGWS